MLSVIVPIFNSEKTLMRCLQSILSQTYRDLEVICVNDGSTDASRSIVVDQMKSDARIKLVDKANGGLSSARNAGLNVATGECVAFVDSDDYIATDMYEKMLSVLDADGVDLVGCGAEIHYEAWEWLKESDSQYYEVRLGRRVPVANDVFSKMDVSAWNKIFKKGILDRYEIRFPEGMWYEDAAFIWSYLPMCERISFVKDRLYHYFRYPSSIMGLTFSKKTTKVLDHLRIADWVIDFLARNHKLNQYADAFSAFLFSSLNFSSRHLSLQRKYLAYIELSRVLRHLQRAGFVFSKNSKEGRFFIFVKDHSLMRVLFSVFLQRVSAKLRAVVTGSGNDE